MKKPAQKGQNRINPIQATKDSVKKMIKMINIREHLLQEQRAAHQAVAYYVIGEASR